MGIGTMKHRSNCGCGSNRSPEPVRYGPPPPLTRSTTQGLAAQFADSEEQRKPAWTMVAVETFAGGFAIKARYAEASNYDGMKIMVYRGVYREDYVGDPHFCESGHAPLARFAPTSEGWDMARALARSLT